MLLVSLAVRPARRAQPGLMATAAMAAWQVMAATVARVSRALRARMAQVLATAALMAKLVAVVAMAPPEAPVALLGSVAVRVACRARPELRVTAATAATLVRPATAVMAEPVM